MAAPIDIADELTSRVDRLVSSRAALSVACAWGVAEATFFFIVPDVGLSLVACRALRPALKASLMALVGALVGGALMYGFGMVAPRAAHDFLNHVPAISPALMTRVVGQIDERGLVAVLIGPLKGIPYKIYAVEWGARSGSLVGFLLISIPARYVRFLLASLAARGIARICEPLTRHRARVELAILATLWIAFYAFYFSRFGW